MLRVHHLNTWPKGQLLFAYKAIELTDLQNGQVSGKVMPPLNYHMFVWSVISDYLSLDLESSVVPPLSLSLLSRGEWAVPFWIVVLVGGGSTSDLNTRSGRYRFTLDWVAWSLPRIVLSCQRESLLRVSLPFIRWLRKHITDGELTWQSHLSSCHLATVDLSFSVFISQGGDVPLRLLVSLNILRWLSKALATLFQLSSNLARTFFFRWLNKLSKQSRTDINYPWHRSGISHFMWLRRADRIGLFHRLNQWPVIHYLCRLLLSNFMASPWLPIKNGIRGNITCVY